jgi:hypothetical protein
MGDWVTGDMETGDPSPGLQGLQEICRRDLRCCLYNVTENGCSVHDIITVGLKGIWGGGGTLFRLPQ